MSLRSGVIFVALLLLGLSSTDALAQDAEAEVRTWSGRSLRLSQVSFEVRYTIVLARGAGGAYGGGGGGALAGGALGGSGVTGAVGAYAGSPIGSGSMST